MKHYRIGIVAGSHVFEFMCSTMSEAYDAVQDADCTFRLGIDMNKLMVNLVKMNAGELLSTIQHTLRLSIEDGEV